MRSNLRLAGALVLAALAAAARADDWKDCIQKADPDIAIRGCAAILAQESQSAAEGTGFHRKADDYRRAFAFNNLGAALCEKGEYDQAIAVYTRAMELNFSCPYCRARAYAAKGEYDRAIADYTIALSPFGPDRNDAAGFAARGLVYLKIGKIQEALADAGQALKLHPGDPGALQLRGRIFEALGRREEAIADFRRAVSLNPGDREASNALKRLGAEP